MPTHDQIRDILQENSLFNALTPKLLDRIIPICTIVKKDINEYLFQISDPASGFFIVISGLVKVFRHTAEGDEHILHFFSEGDSVAEAAIFDLQVYPASCTALVPTTYLYIESKAFIHLLSQYPELSMAVINSLSRRLRKFTTMIEELSLKHVSARLASFLHENATQQSGRWIVRLEVSKSTLASHLGTIKETLSRSFRKLKDMQIINERAEGFIEILNPSDLLAIAKRLD